uniref:MPN domain-containing protein n=1 Tax=Rhizochromulina marina TaxID=1034831 RepID=A0A7S2WTW0_9STRA|mmetsp:Transcript_505/g.1634  ORF Transcript_505/g.1634 Transcript_505/m.1634 type:complete len:214 (+) Transcript_505:42-683(+)|eukprot:CAMPEP_0118963234 /NCGR_PEP_ID=MMETSP1173-20130426/1229_1 /TAXON_ID=1034831 /ORGANISM="Rhizochromulina marina cf, Strain CCMP1243" /LENGTH=213 /DNA_ID=CAMNT_0006911553 /DNA_START=13 /DNA_END=654 /DNA_ORIENTATION=+
MAAETEGKGPWCDWAAEAYAKVVLHAVKHPHCGVSGFLLGSVEDGGRRVLVADAVPLFHSHPLAPGLEAAAQLVTAAGGKIVGFYESNASASTKGTYSLVGERAMQTIEAECAGAVLVCLVSERLAQPKDHALQVLRRGGGRWDVKLRARDADSQDVTMPLALQLCREAVSLGLHEKLVDFDDHLEDVSKNPLNPAVAGDLGQLVATQQKAAA